MARESGAVKWFDPIKGFGFIEREKGRDVFLHATEVEKSELTGKIKEGDKVTFEIQDKAKGPSAINIEKA